MIPKAVVAGLVQGVVGTGTGAAVLSQGAMITRDIVNRIWSDVVKDYPYQSLQFDPSGRGAAFLGEGGPEDAVILQTPIVQVRALAVNDPRSVGGVAQQAAAILKIALHHLGGPPPLNLGVKVVYNCPAPGNNAVDFIRSELIKGDDDLQAMAGGAAFEASLKVIIKRDDVLYTVLVEPLQSNLSDLFIDIDAQYPGIVDVGQIESRITAVDEFVTTHVQAFLDRRAQEWSK